MKILILTCVYNDWLSLNKLLTLLEHEFVTSGIEADVLVVDDGSMEERPVDFASASHKALGKIDVLRLRRNLGHQRAIAVGLCYVYAQKIDCDAVLVMDADGEDEPADAVRLISASRREMKKKVVFAERSQRSEGFSFTFFYNIYRLLHWILTGNGIRVGNFSIIPYSILGSIVVDSNLWNHYAASVWMSKIEIDTIPSRRGKRFYGKSKLSFTSLVVHGLSAISCYKEHVGVRLLIGSSVGMAVLLCFALGTVGVKIFTNWAIPGWATTMIGLVIIMGLQLLLMSIVFTSLLLAARSNQAFIPLREYTLFVDHVERINGNAN